MILSLRNAAAPRLELPKTTSEGYDKQAVRTQIFVETFRGSKLSSRAPSCQGPFIQMIQQQYRCGDIRVVLHFVFYAFRNISTTYHVLHTAPWRGVRIDVPTLINRR